jgi:hypothetical protein
MEKQSDISKKLTLFQKNGITISTTSLSTTPPIILKFLHKMQVYLFVQMYVSCLSNYDNINYYIMLAGSWQICNGYNNNDATCL